MPMAAPAVLALNGGELSKALDGRVDLEKYASGCRVLENWLPRVQGGVTKRPGLRFVNEARRAQPARFFLDSFAVSTGVATTTQARSGYGFTPKAIIVWTTGRTEGTTTAGRASLSTSFGFASHTTRRFAVSAFSEDAQATMDTQRRWTDDAVVLTITDTGAVDGLLDVQSFDADGVTFVVDDQFTAGVRVTVLAIGGPDVQAFVHGFNQPNVLGTSAHALATFRPNCVLFASAFASGETGLGDTALSIGVAAGPDDAIENAVTSIFDDNAAADSQTLSYSRRGECIAQIDGTAVVSRAAVVGWTGGGVRLETLDPPSSSLLRVGTLSLAGADFRVGSVQTLTSTGVDIPVTGLPFAPKFALFGSHGKSESLLGVAQDDAEISLGAFVSSSSQQAQGSMSDDAQASSVIGTAIDYDAVYVNMPAAASSVEGVMRCHAVGSDGFTLRMSDADPSAAFAWYLTGGDLAASTVRLIPFRFSRRDAYQLEFGGRYMRVYRNGAPVLRGDVAIASVSNTTPVVVTTALATPYETGDDVFLEGTGIAALDGRAHRITVLSPTTFELDDSTAPGATSTTGTAARVYEIETPYAAEDVHLIDARAQIADVIYLTHPDYAPRKLSRTDHTAWTLEEYLPDWFPFAPENSDQDVTIGADGVTGSVTLTSPTGLFTDTMIGAYVSLREVPESAHPEWTEGGAYGTGYEAFIGGGAIAAGDFLQYEGRVYEIMSVHGAGSPVTGQVPPTHEDGIRTDGRLSLRFVNYGAGYAQITAVASAFRATATVVKQLPRSVVSPDLTITNAANAAGLIRVTSAGHGLDTGDKVFIFGVVGTGGLDTAINDQRWTVTRIDANNVDLQGSAFVGAYSSGGTMVQYSWSTTTAALASTFYPTLWRWAWGAWSDERGYPVTACFFEDRLGLAGTRSNPQTAWFSKSGEYADHRVTRDATSALVPTINAEDAIEWAVGKDTLQIGTGAAEFGTKPGDPGMTPENVAQLLRHRSENGSREGVFPVRIGSALLFVDRAGRKLRELFFDDAVQAQVAPDLTRLADHITSGKVRALAFQASPDRVLWAIREDGALIALTYEREDQVFAWHRHPVGGTDARVESIAVIPHPDGSADQLWAAVSRTINGEPRLYVEVLEQTWREENAIEDAFFVDSGLTYSGAADTVIRGLNHLEGEAVAVLAAGLKVTGLSVSGGQITLPTAATPVQIGLGYDARLETMRVEGGAQDGTSQGRKGRTLQVVVRMAQMGEGLFMGPSLDEYMEEVPLPAGALTDGDTTELPWPGGNERDRRLALRHSTPLPAGINAIFPRLDVAA